MTASADVLEYILSLRDEFTNRMRAAGLEAETFERKAQQAGETTTLTFTEMNQFLELAQKGVAGLRAALDGTLGVILRQAEATAEYAAATENAAMATAVTAEELQELNHLVEIQGVSQEKLRVGLRQLNKNMHDFSRGTGEAKVAFTTLGIEVRDGKGNLRSTLEVFQEASERLKNLENDTERAALAQRLLGESGSELAPIFQLGADGIRELRQEARDMGLVMDQQAITKFRSMGDEIRRVQEMLDALARDAVEPFADDLEDLARDAQKWIRENRELLIEYANFAEQVAKATVHAIKENIFVQLTEETFRFLSRIGEAAGEGAAVFDRLRSGRATTGDRATGREDEARRARVEAARRAREEAAAIASSDAAGFESFGQGAFPDFEKFAEDARRAQVQLSLARADGFGKLKIQMEEELRRFEGNEEAKALIRERFSLLEDQLFQEKLNRSLEEEAREEERLAREQERTQLEEERQQERRDRELERLEMHHATRLEILEQAEQRELEVAGRNEKLRSRIQQHFAGERQNISEQERRNRLMKQAAMGAALIQVTQAFEQAQFLSRKDAAKAQALLGMYEGANRALALPFPESLFAWAQVLATGKKGLSGVEGTTLGGGGGAVGGGGGSPGRAPPPPQIQQPPPPPQAPPQQLGAQVMVIVQGDSLDHDGLVEKLSPALRDAVTDGRLSFER